MIFSKTCQAALKSVAILASEDGLQNKYSIKELAKLANENEHTLAKVLQLLVRNGLICSMKGPKGGFFIEIKQLRNPVLKIVEAIDGTLALNDCVLGFTKCTDKKPCAFHVEFKKSRQIIHNLLNNNTVADLGKADKIFKNL